MDQKTTVVEMSGAGGEGTTLKCARLRDGLSRIPEMTVEMAAQAPRVDLEKVVGRAMGVKMVCANGEIAEFKGVCVQATYLGIRAGAAHYGLEVRPWLWYLTRRRDTRIFQDKTALDIIKEVLAEYGFSANLTDKTTHSFVARTYCVQYRETDFAFISRLMEQEGMYYFFDYAQPTEKLVLCDGAGAHTAVPGFDKITFMPKDETVEFRDDQISEWYGDQRVTTGQVTLDDYNFESPKSDLTEVKKIQKGKWAHNDLEDYDYPGGYRAGEAGAHYARVRMESLAIRNRVWTGVGNVRGLSAGHTFKLDKHPRADENQEYLVTGVTHYFLNTLAYREDEDFTSLQPGLVLETGPEPEAYTCEIEAVPKAEPYRAPQLTPWPKVGGVHTALVVGKGGEEIWTDKYGRIRVQFHWDRDGQKDDKSTCWVRYASPWTGKQWGMVHIPRIGQEVIVDFEEGDPDRPIATGCVWNGDNMPPYPLPANQTIQGVKTNKSKGGGGFNEFVLEDKAGAEYVRMQSERDYFQIVKNDAFVDIGAGHKNLGDLTQHVNRNKTEIVREVRTHVTGLIEDLTAGLVYDETVGMAKTQVVGIYKEEKVGIGKQDVTTPSGLLGSAVTAGGPLSTLYKGGKYADIGAAATAISALAGALKQPGKKEEIHGVSELEVLGDRIQTVKKSSYAGPSKPGLYKTTVEDGDMQTYVKKGNKLTTVSKGDVQLGIETGDYITGVDKGNQKTTVKMGNYELKVSKGKVTIQAMQSIELKVGSNKIKIDMSGVSIEGTMIKEKAKAQLKMEAPMIEAKGKGMLKAEAPMVKIEGKALGMFKAPLAQVDGSALVMVKGGIAMLN